MTKLEAAKLKNPNLDYTDEEIIKDYCPKMLGVGDELYGKNCVSSPGSLKCEQCWNEEVQK